MKKIILSIISIVLMAQMVSAQQSTADTVIVAHTSYLKSSSKLCPSSWFGVRGGLNFSDMKYTFDQIDRYDHTLRLQGMIGVFGQFQLGQSNFSLRPELSFVGRADSLRWADVHYGMKVNYLDFRLPVTYNFRFANTSFSPYLMVAPMMSLAYGGRVSYHDEDFVNGVYADITKADIRPTDFAVMFGAGVDYVAHLGKMPLQLSLEAGYNLGLGNTFAEREIKDNENVASAERSIIKNMFFGAELYQEKRHNRGIELALRVAVPIDGCWKNQRQDDDAQYLMEFVQHDTIYIRSNDTVFVKVEDRYIDTIYLTPSHTRDTLYITRIDSMPGNTDTIYLNNGGKEMEYVHKDCYSFSEMYAFLTLGVDISDKRMCLFNINFDFDSYRLRSESKAPLNDVARMMKTFPEMRIKIIGHTDNVGSDKYNKNLSQQRARSVAKYLNSQGIKMNRMETEGFGESYPIDDNSTQEGRFRNRRVEIEVLNVGMRVTDNNK